MDEAALGRINGWDRQFRGAVYPGGNMEIIRSGGLKNRRQPQGIVQRPAILDKIVAVDLIESGKTEDDVVQAAASRSVMIAAGRLYFEDSLLIGRGKLAQSNAEQVRKIRLILEELGYEIATPDDAREMLDLKGADKVNF